MEGAGEGEAPTNRPQTAHQPPESERPALARNRVFYPSRCGFFGV